MKVRKAVIPAAGLGTRMRPFSAAVPKELVPLGTKPGIHLTVEEAAAAGLTDIAVVLRPGKELIRTSLERAVADGDLPEVGFEFIFQEEAKGLAEAMTLCRSFSAGEPFALLLPDNAFLHPDYRLSALIELFQETGRDVVGVLDLDDSHSGHFGNSGLFEGEQERPGVWRITELRSKGPGTITVPPGGTLRRTCGRYVCHPDVFDFIDRVRPSVQGEYSEVPAYQRIVAERGIYGLSLPAPPFDLGNPRGYLAASAHLYRRLTPKTSAG